MTFDAPFALPKPEFVSNAVEGVTLVEGEHYTLDYDCGEPTELGADRRVTLTVSGKDGTAYAGYATTIAFTLRANRMTVAAIPDQLWQGSDVSPVPTVTDPDRGTALAFGQDFTVDYADNGRPAENVVTATAIVSGAAGTRYAGVTVEVPYQVHAPVFTIAAIPGVMYLGSAVEPSVTVTRDFDGVALTRDVDFTVAYANNGGVGVAKATVSGKSGTMYAGYSATREFNILEPAYTDDYIMTSDPNPERMNANGNIVYRFSDAAAGEIAIGFRQQVTIERTLTVGGGGGGGGCVAGAGGGGGVIARKPVLLIPPGTAGALQVGAGGAGGAASGFKAGENGGHSKLVLAGLDDHAYGGGGGGSYSYEPGKAAVTGEIGSGGGNGQKGGTTTADKTWYNSTQGNRGAMVTCGGGGGAGQAATSNPGGEGVTNDITGVEEVYGAGGGGGAGNGYNVNGSAGGTHGGCGAAQGSSTGGTDGDDGFGAGGGGGSYGANSQPVTSGGRGGSGVVLLAFQLGDRTQYRFEVLPIADQYYTMSAIEPEVVVSNPVSAVVLARGTDYDVAYSANVQIGTATVTVTGRDGTPYAGYVAVGRFRIRPPTFTILPIADQYYTMSAIEPDVVVSNPVSHAVLVRGTDYELEFENNTAVGTASVIAVGKEGTPYEGFRAGASFAIRAPTISIAAVEDAWFDGNEACPEPAVTRDFDGAALVKNVDFIYSYTNNSAVGTVIVAAIGMDGTRYAGLSASTTFELKAQTFSIDPIPDQLYLGAAVAPEVTVVRDHDGDTLSVWTDVEIFYADNDAVGTATVTASGRVNTAYAGLSATRTFNIVPAWYDDYVVTDDTSVRATNVGGRLVYIFTNAAKTVQFKLRQNMTLKDALVVGGGGAGGSVIGGGGGGGGVVTLAVERVFFEGARLDIVVGRGGTPLAANNWGQAGGGGASIVTVNSASYLEAFGGGGGGGYSCSSFSSGKWGSSGGVGGNVGSLQILEGYNWTKGQGNPGAQRVDGNLGGGGGGAFKAGSASNGGEGVTNAITGVEEVYGSGGGGSSRSGGYSAAQGNGGTHAGRAGVTAGHPGDDGFGGGGGAGSYKDNVSAAGGRGGSGIVVLSFAVGGEAGQPEIASAEIDFPYGTTQPRATVVLGGKPTAAYSATVKMMLGMDGETWLQTEDIPDVSNGKSAELLGDFSPASGSDIHLQVVVWAEGAQERVTNLVVRTDNPQSPHYGKGGGAGVIHVRPGATGKNDGTDWFNACTDFREAIKQLSAGRDELWFAGDELVKVDPPSINPSVAATLRGGFGGLETSPAGRADGAYSTISVEGPHTALSIANAEALTLEGFRTRGGSRGLSKSGAGALTVTNCVFEKVSSSSGEALGVVVKGTGIVRFANVRFSEFYQTDTATQRNGAALFLNGPSRVYLDDCLFVSNGVPFSAGSGSNQAYAMRGSALYSSGTPLTARNCRFVGNRGQTLDVGGEGGGVVRLDGACGGSAFSNCFFVANENIHGYSNYSDYPTDKGAGALTLILGAAGRTVDVVNCTFAYNLIEGREATAGLNVRSGTANVRNSIFFGQVRNPLTSVGRDILVNGATAAVNVDYTLFAEVSTNTCSTLNDGQLKLGKGIVTGDPLFVAPADEIDGFVSTGWYKFDHTKQTKLLNWANVHLRGGSGYVDEKTGETVKAYRRLGTSPALNTGDPKSDYANEPKPNGRRVNLGAYGNTPWATMSPAGTALIVR